MACPAFSDHPDASPFKDFRFFASGLKVMPGDDRPNKRSKLDKDTTQVRWGVVGCGNIAKAVQRRPTRVVFRDSTVFLFGTSRIL
jgi:hypothetical protein